YPYQETFRRACAKEIGCEQCGLEPAGSCNVMRNPFNIPSHTMAGTNPVCRAHWYNSTSSVRSATRSPGQEWAIGSFGGWAVDFAVGDMTRQHRDVDFVIWEVDLP